MMTDQKQLLAACLGFIRDGLEEQGYGFPFPGLDPRKFSPDEESCTPEEMEAWRAACEAAGRGEYEVEPDEFPAVTTIDDPLGGRGEVVAHVTRTPWGMGVYTLEREPTAIEADLIKRLEAALKEQEVPRG